MTRRACWWPRPQPTEDGGLHVYIEGDTKLGKVNDQQDLHAREAEDSTARRSETVAVLAFQKAMLIKAYQAQAAKIAEEEAAQRQHAAVAGRHRALHRPREWNAIRSRILDHAQCHRRRSLDASTSTAR